MTLICAAIGENAPVGMLEAADEAITAGVDLVEYRLDLMIDTSEEAIIEVMNSNRHPAIFTIRPVSEEGGFDGNEEKRLELISLALEHVMNEPEPFCYVDIEAMLVNSIRDQLDDLPGLLAHIILSVHDHQQTPEREEIVRTLSSIAPYCAIVKGSYMTRGIDDAVAIMKAASDLSLENISFAVMGMGPYGPKTRKEAFSEGCKLVYGSIREGTAPGQLSVRDLLAIRNNV